MEKLVRDKIPEIIKSRWEDPDFYIANDLEYKIELFKKLLEESLEVKKSNNKEELIEELADVIEVINSICKNSWISMEDIEKARLKKLDERWWFDDKIILEIDD